MIIIAWKLLLSRSEAIILIFSRAFLNRLRPPKSLFNVVQPIVNIVFFHSFGNKKTSIPSYYCPSLFLLPFLCEYYILLLVDCINPADSVFGQEVSLSA